MDEIKLVKLTSTINEIELGMIKEILEDNNIPYIAKDNASGGYMRIVFGSSVFGTDIMVEEDSYDEANQLLESINLK